MKQGNQIKLRDWIKEDLERYEFWYTGKKKWMDFDAPYYRKPSKKEIQDKLSEITESIKINNWQIPRKRLVIANRDDDKLIGTVSWYWQSEETNWKSIGIVIYDEQYWGKGIGFDALQLWMDYLFKIDSRLIRLDLRTWSGNQRMMQLAKKLGFKEEARFRKARIINGKYFDSIGMGILREEWSQ